MHFSSTNQDFENEYPKLVRDRIPEIIKDKTGKFPETRILESDEEYLKFLLKKLVEEARELEYALKQGNTQEELADVLEIINAVLKLKGWSLEDIEKVRQEKNAKNGSFEKRILMLKK